MANVIPEIKATSEHLHLLDALLHVANDARFGQTHTGNHHKRTTKADTVFFSVYPLRISLCVLFPFL